jgi:UDP-glucose-4-epimerase GalE
MSVLVTGGAGYIGAAFVERLCGAGERAVVLDDLSRGHRVAVPPGVPLYQGRCGDGDLVARIVREEAVEACVHFAAFAYVGESVGEPKRYFDNNTAQALGLFETLLGLGVGRVVFSSTCATYGVPHEVPIPETHPQWPINPYGWSKFFVERMLEAFDHAHGLRFVGLRYFNAAGATSSHGERHDPETHLIPLVLQAAAGRRPHVSVFGTDYPTPDGTAVRDYIHVEDLADAHLAALRHLRGGGTSLFLSLGTGLGYSVREVIDAARRVTGREVPVVESPRREGDPPRLVADACRAREVLGWTPRRPELEDIIGSAWAWAQSGAGAAR